ncbi:OmpA family protein [Pedobacter ureilyticus]|uniref:OmpA family protein n=1 Tax=Pedobacter ureilyticus TaxID=1393051 RepID=A0ABW9J097_9SPHI|nr:OmpA family protein [Pedobacter helvus]
MAHLEVRPKPSRPWWMWALLIIILIALGAMVFNQCNQNPENHPSIVDQTKDSLPKNKAVAATSSDWEKIDFNAKQTTDTTLKATDIYTRTDGNYTIYSLGQNLLFDAKSNQLNANGIDKLRQIAEMLKQRFPEGTIGVFGNTDAFETADDKKLGMLRAQAVKDWLSKEGKIDAQHISVRSLGDSQPVASNRTSEGREQNRNVAIVVFPKKFN